MSRDQVISELNRLRDEALTNAKFPLMGLHLELYSGVSIYSKHLRRLGFAVVSFDIRFGAHFNLDNWHVQHVIFDCSSRISSAPCGLERLASLGAWA